jgi:hypothetical protein
MPKHATETFVNAAVAALINAAPSALDTLKELADALGSDPNFATTMTSALAGKAAIGDGASAGAAATSALLKQWTSADAYELTAITYDANQIISGGTVKWPDGSAGTLTVTSANATWRTVDAYTISHTLSGKTVTQSAVTRNASGNVTVKPALTVA